MAIWPPSDDRMLAATDCARRMVACWEAGDRDGWMDAFLAIQRRALGPLGGVPGHEVYLHELGNTYVAAGDRFVVSLLAGYAAEDLTDAIRARGGSVNEGSLTVEAAASALDLTRDEGSSGTHWYVYDRATGRIRQLEQSECDGSDGALICSGCGRRSWQDELTCACGLALGEDQPERMVCEDGPSPLGAGWS